MVYITDKETNNAFVKKEFNLSEKIFWVECANDKHGRLRKTGTSVGTRKRLYVKDVKEFIRLQNILLDQLYRREISWSEFTAENNKLAGEKLINSPETSRSELTTGDNKEPEGSSSRPSSGSDNSPSFPERERLSSMKSAENSNLGSDNVCECEEPTYGRYDYCVKCGKKFKPKLENE